MPLVSELQGVVLSPGLKPMASPRRVPLLHPRVVEKQGCTQLPPAPLRKMAESRSSLSQVSCEHARGAQLSTCRFA